MVVVVGGGWWWLGGAFGEEGCLGWGGRRGTPTSVLLGVEFSGGN